MHQLFLNIALLFTLFCTNVSAQVDISESVGIALKNGNAAELSKYFNSSIELSILEKPMPYSKMQAEIIIKDFFVKHPPSSFAILSKNIQHDKSKYSIGNLITTDGKYIVYFYMISVGNVNLIQEIKIEKEVGLTAPKRF